MKFKILVTGGAGFIGSYIVDALVKDGHAVTILDSLEPQVHPQKPDYLNPKAKFVKGSILDTELLKKSVTDADIIFHQAARVGVGQSMYEVSSYTNTNIMGMANLLNILANESHNVKKLVVSGSNTSYGEGAYNCDNCSTVYPNVRSEEQLKKRKWELTCSCGRPLIPIATNESKPIAPTSVYAVSKSAQEQLALSVCKAFGIPAVALRYFLVYGPRQSLSNPYTGVASIFMARIRNNKPPIIFEDGLQSRDFVSVHDVVQANLLAMKSSSANGELFNVASGSQITIKAVAETLIALYKKSIRPEITGNFRKGDIRHCFADISKIKSRLGYQPKISFQSGMRELMDWTSTQEVAASSDRANLELKKRGLLG